MVFRLATETQRLFFSLEFYNKVRDERHISFTRPNDYEFAYLHLCIRFKDHKIIVRFIRYFLSIEENATRFHSYGIIIIFIFCSTRKTGLIFFNFRKAEIRTTDRRYEGFVRQPEVVVTILRVEPK